MPELEPHPPQSLSTPAGDAAGHATGAARAAEPADPLAKLRKMSTTAGVGSQDYVAINPAAITALMLGIGGLLALLHDLLLVVPLAGLVFAAVAWRQVRNSNGTQTGAGLALTGAVLSLLICGATLGSRAYHTWSTRGDREAIAALIREFGADLTAARYDQAYQRFSQRFRDRVSRRDFEARWEELKYAVNSGNYAGMEWNGTRMHFSEEAGTGTETAAALVVFRFERPQEYPLRRPFEFVKEGDKWVLDNFVELFPRRKASAS